MKRTFFVLLATVLSGAAFGACQSVYDPMNHQWVYACSPNGNPTPQCHNEYDPMNHVSVLVCR